MRDDLVERRERTWDLHVIKGFSTSEVSRKLASQYGVKEATIRKDISKMDEWLGKLDDHTSKTAASRMRELRQNRQRMHQMAMEARSDDDLKEELRIRRAIDSNIDRDVNIAQSLGVTHKEPDRHEHDVEADVRGEHAHEHRLDPELREQLDAAKQNAEADASALAHSGQGAHDDDDHDNDNEREDA